MLRKLMSMSLVVIMSSAVLVGCSSTDETQPVEFSQEQGVPVEVEPTNLVIDAETCTIELTDIKKIKDWEGKPAIEIQYTFTNKLEEPACATAGTIMEAFQNGKSLELGTSNDEEFNELVDLMQGMSQEKCRACFLTEDDSIVTLYVVETWEGAWVEHNQMPTFEIDLSNPESISIIRVAN